MVGASSGLGRSIALGLAGKGDRVALLARRVDRLRSTVAEAGDDAVVVPCDVTDEAGATHAIHEAADKLGGLDGLLYAAGFLTVEPIEKTDAAMWRALFDVNVIGAATVTSAALPHLAETHGKAAYLSSVSGATTAHWPYIGAYSTTKAALERLIEAWRDEHPEVSFTRLVVGDSAGGRGDSATGLVDDVDADYFGTAVSEWDTRCLRNGELIHPGDLVRTLDLIFSARASIASITVTPRPPKN